MSLHIEMTPEAEAELKRTVQRNRLSSIAIAVLCCFLGGLTLYLTVKLFEEQEPAALTTYTPPLEDLPPTKQPVTKQLQSRPASASSSVAPSVVVAAAAGPVAMAEVDVPTDSMDFGTGMELGVGFGTGGLGDGIGSGGTGLGTEQAGGSTLEGTFYDLKQTTSGAPTGMNPEMCKKVLSEFNSSGWSKSVLSKYYQAPTKLYSACFYMPICKADEAPYAYKVEDKVKPSMWVAVYRGKVKAPKTGKFRFVGLGDDSLAVRFGNKTVFDYGWSSVSSGKMLGGNAANRAELKDTKGQGRQFYKYSTAGADWNNNLDGLCTGDVFEVKEGQTYPIELLISELPGGYFGFVLLIEDMDSPPTKKDGMGSPIFQLFRTNFAEPNTDELYKNMKVPGDRRSDVPYDKDSLIWQSV